MPPRVVSLIPSATEIVALVGGLDRLVGRSHECDFPAQVASLPMLTSQRTHLNASSEQGFAEVDEQVRAAVSSGESLYALDENLLERLAPDIILTQDLCSVCSLDLAAVRRVGERISSKPRIVSLNPETVEGVLDDVMTVGEAIGLAAAGEAAMVDLRRRLFEVTEYVNPFADGPSAAFLEWPDPIFVGGHWTPQLIERGGARHPLNPTRPVPGAGAAAGPQSAGRVAGKSVTVTPEALVESAPEFIIIAPCGVALPDVRHAAARLRAQPWWPSLPAVRLARRGETRIALVDGSAMFNRPGPRLVDAQEFLVGFFEGHPELIPPDFPWEPYTDA